MPAHLRTTLLALAAASALSACGSPPSTASAPLDRFSSPIALGLSGGELLVVSTNFDLSFDLGDGGSVIPVDLGASPPALREGVRIPSYGGELAIAEPAACGLPERLAVVPVREGNALYRIAVRPDGALVCGEGCRTPLRDDLQDAFGVAVVCRADDPATPANEHRASAFVSFLRTPSSRGQILEIDLASGAPVSSRDVGLGPVRSFAYDELTERLFMTSVESGTTAPLRWLELAGSCAAGVAAAAGGCPIGGVDLASFLRGAEPRGVALSNPQPGRTRRAFVAARVYNADLAATIGARPGFDVGGVLFVLDLVDGRSGLEPRLAGIFDVGLGANEVEVLPVRPGKGDLVAVTATDDGLLWIYDDEQRALVRVFGRDPHTGIPLLGRQPFGLAMRDDGASARLFVSSFEDGFVTPVDVPLDAPWTAADPSAAQRIGVKQ